MSGRWIVRDNPGGLNMEDLLTVKRKMREALGGVEYQPTARKKKKPAITTNEIQPGKPGGK